MRIFVAGATGAIGRPLIAQLLAKGHDVVALTRSPEKAQTLAEQGVEPAIADVFDADAVKAAVTRAQPEVVIEQLTSLPKTYTRESMSAAAALNTRIRREGGANVLAAAQAAGVRRYLRQSIAFWAAPGTGLADEKTFLVFDASPTVEADAHTVNQTEHRLLRTPNIEGIVLRYGFFYGPGTWFASNGDVAQQVRQQQFPIIGNGEGVWSWVHIEDAAEATVAAVERGNPGTYLITDDHPLEMRVWLSAYAHWLNAPPPPQVSVEDALRIGGADAVYYGTQVRGVSNAKAKRELNFRPRLLEWMVHTAVAHTSQPTYSRLGSLNKSRLNGKVALVTGGTTGIGFATAQLFVQEGAKVAITGQNQERLDQASKALGAEALAIRADARSPGDLDTVFAQIKERWGRLDILFVNAGFTKFRPLLNVDEAFINETMDINLKGALFTVQKAVPLMPANSSIVFNTSINDQMAMSGSGIYAASKAALRSLVSVLAAELIERGIRVNAVSPGPIKTPLYNKLRFSQDQWDQVTTNFQQTIPMKRFGEPEEIAKAVLFLASDEASFVLGEELVVDGGWTRIIAS